MKFRYISAWFRRSRSRPARALWIEIDWLDYVYSLNCVEAREGLVD